jgi:Ser/Thr protein kinase RdoA (MazF antagonist)
LLTQVETEHAILAQLATQKLSFEVPTALPAVETGAPYVVLSSGAAACVFEIIPGKPAGRHRQAQVYTAAAMLISR